MVAGVGDVETDGTGEGVGHDALGEKETGLVSLAVGVAGHTGEPGDVSDPGVGNGYLANGVRRAVDDIEVRRALIVHP